MQLFGIESGTLHIEMHQVFPKDSSVMRTYINCVYPITLRCVVLQCGGNDVEKQPSNEVTKEYDCLIGDIQQRCPRASIILSKIPPRRHNKDVLNKIIRVNTYLQYKFSFFR